MRKQLERIFEILDRMPQHEHERFVERFCITASVGLACVVSSMFYWFLPPLLRVLVVPIFIGGAWWFGAAILAKLILPLKADVRKDFKTLLQSDELRCLGRAIVFTGSSCAIASITCFCVPEFFVYIFYNPQLRTTFLSLFTWTLIGAPLFAQSKTSKDSVLIACVFAFPLILCGWTMVG